MSQAEAKALEKKLHDRPEKEFLVDHNIMKPDNVDPSLQGVREHLAKEQTMDVLEKKMELRSSPHTLMDRNILHCPPSPSVEHQKAKENLSHRLDPDVRPSLENLQQHNIVHSGAPKIQAEMLELEKEITKDKLERKLKNQPSLENLQQHNIVHSGAPKIQAEMLELEKEITKDKLEKKLKLKPEREELVERNVLCDQHMAPSVQGAQKELKKAQLIKALNTKLGNRLSKEEFSDIVKGDRAS